MAWTMRSPKKIAHTDGHYIELISGSWRVPYEINPKILRGTDSMESARLIREGMLFAERQNQRMRVGV